MEILREIENVDHNNPHAMFRLNELVYKWLLTVNPSTPYGKFVFSRDTLKAIRPEGWVFEVQNIHPWALEKRLWRVTGYFHKFENEPYELGSISVSKRSDCKTEELAELHAIIQAIDHDRSQK